MATFKVGQRVRIVRCNQLPEIVGAEATILGPAKECRGSTLGNYWGYPVDIDGYGRINHLGHQVHVPADWIAPLTDPRADEFIADMERYAHIAKEKNVKEPA